MGKPGMFDDEDVKEILQAYEKISKEMNKSMGYHVIEPDYNLVMEKIEAGYTFIAFSLDTLFLGTICRDQMTQLKKSLS